MRDDPLRPEAPAVAWTWAEAVQKGALRLDDNGTTLVVGGPSFSPQWESEARVVAGSSPPAVRCQRLLVDQQWPRVAAAQSSLLATAAAPAPAPAPLPIAQRRWYDDVVEPPPYKGFSALHLDARLFAPDTRLEVLHGQTRRTLRLRRRVPVVHPPFPTSETPPPSSAGDWDVVVQRWGLELVVWVGSTIVFSTVGDRQGYFEEAADIEDNFCVLCRVAMGAHNPRQLCCKRFCDNEPWGYDEAGEDEEAVPPPRKRAALASAEEEDEPAVPTAAVAVAGGL